MNNISAEENDQNLVERSKPVSGLYIQSEDRQKIFPLKHTDVTKIAGNVARAEVTQTFKNSFQ